MTVHDALKEYLPKGPIWDYKFFGPMGLDDLFQITVSIKVKKDSPWIDYILDLNTKEVSVKERE